MVVELSCAPITNIWDFCHLLANMIDERKELILRKYAFKILIQAGQALLRYIGACICCELQPYQYCSMMLRLSSHLDTNTHIRVLVAPA